MNVYHPIRVLTNLLTRASKTLFFSPNSCLLELWASSLISPHHKEGGIYCCFALYHFFKLLYLGRTCESAIMSPPTDMISPCLRRRQSLVSLYKKWCSEKKQWDFVTNRFFTNICFHIFIIHVLWFDEPATCNFSTPAGRMLPRRRCDSLASL